MHLVLGTRGSLLAKTQSEWIASKLRACGHDVELRIIETRGDREQSKPIPELGGKGLFTAELEAALRDGSIHLAVHSLKDLPVDDAEGIAVAAIPEREMWQDALVTPGAVELVDLPSGARIGTASRRRTAFLLQRRPDIEVVPIRGNVDTRIARTLGGDLDGVVVAAAGLIRLNRGDVPHVALDFLPAPAQGALGVQARSESGPVHEALAVLHDVNVERAVRAERAVLAALEGGCSTPLGALAVLRERTLHLRASIAQLDGRVVLSAEAEGEDPDQIALEVADRLFEQGAQEILDATH